MLLQELGVENVAEFAQPMSYRTNVGGFQIVLIAELVAFLNELGKLLVLPVDFLLHVQLGFRESPVGFAQVAASVLRPSDRYDYDGA